MFSDYLSHLMKAGAYIILALNWEVLMVTMTMVLKLQAKKSQRDVGGANTSWGEFYKPNDIFYKKKTFKCVLYIQGMHLIMPYISLGYRLH